MVAAIAIILLVSIAKGVQKDLTDQVNDLGVNVLVVLPFRVEEGSMFMPNAAQNFTDSLWDLWRFITGRRKKQEEETLEQPVAGSSDPGNPVA